MRPPTKSLLLATAACQISCQSDTQIWRYIAIWIFRIFGLKCLFRLPKWGFWGLWTHRCDYSSSRHPKGTSLRKYTSFKLSTVKIHWGVWPVGELTESVTDTHTQIYILSMHSIGQLIKAHSRQFKGSKSLKGGILFMKFFTHFQSVPAGEYCFWV